MVHIATKMMLNTSACRSDFQMREFVDASAEINRLAETGRRSRSSLTTGKVTMTHQELFESSSVDDDRFLTALEYQNCYGKPLIVTDLDQSIEDALKYFDEDVAVACSSSSNNVTPEKQKIRTGGKVATAVANFKTKAANFAAASLGRKNKKKKKQKPVTPPKVKELKEVYEPITEPGQSSPPSKSPKKKSKVRQLTKMFNNTIAQILCREKNNYSPILLVRRPAAPAVIQPVPKPLNNLCSSEVNLPTPVLRPHYQTARKSPNHTCLIAEEMFRELSIKDKALLYSKFFDDMSNKNPEFRKHAEAMKSKVRQQVARSELVPEEQEEDITQLEHEFDTKCSLPKYTICTKGFRNTTSYRSSKRRAPAPPIPTSNTNARETEDIVVQMSEKEHDDGLKEINQLSETLTSPGDNNVARPKPRSERKQRNNNSIHKMYIFSPLPKRSFATIEHSQQREAYAPPMKIRRQRSEYLEPTVFLDNKHMKHLFYNWLKEKHGVSFDITANGNGLETIIIAADKEQENLISFLSENELRKTSEDWLLEKAMAKLEIGDMTNDSQQLDTVTIEEKEVLDTTKPALDKINNGSNQIVTIAEITVGMEGKNNYFNDVETVAIEEKELFDSTKAPITVSIENTNNDLNQVANATIEENASIDTIKAPISVAMEKDNNELPIPSVVPVHQVPLEIKPETSIIVESSATMTPAKESQLDKQDSILKCTPAKPRRMLSATSSSTNTPAKVPELPMRLVDFAPEVPKRTIKPCKIKYPAPPIPARRTSIIVDSTVPSTPAKESQMDQNESILTNTPIQASIPTITSESSTTSTPAGRTEIDENEFGLLNIQNTTTTDESQPDDCDLDKGSAVTLCPEFEFMKSVKPIRKRKIRRSLSWKNLNATIEPKPAAEINSTDSEPDHKQAAVVALPALAAVAEQAAPVPPSPPPPPKKAGTQTAKKLVFKDPPADTPTRKQFGSFELDKKLMRAVNSPNKIKLSYTLTAMSTPSPPLTESENFDTAEFIKSLGDRKWPSVLAAVQKLEPNTPLKERRTPRKEGRTPLKETATPLKETATPLKKIATPLKEIATPAKEKATPLKEKCEKSTETIAIESPTQNEQKPNPMVDSYTDQGFETGTNDADSPVRLPHLTIPKKTLVESPVFVVEKKVDTALANKETDNPTVSSTPLKAGQAQQTFDSPIANHQQQQQQTYSPIQVPPKPPRRRSSIHDTEWRRSSLAAIHENLAWDLEDEFVFTPNSTNDRDSNFFANHKTVPMAPAVCNLPRCIFKEDSKTGFWIRSGEFTLMLDVYYITPDRVRMLYESFNQTPFDANNLCFGIDNNKFNIGKSIECTYQRFPLQRKFSHYWFGNGVTIVHFNGKYLPAHRIQQLFGFLCEAVRENESTSFGIDNTVFSHPPEFVQDNQRYSMESNYSQLVGLQAGKSNGLEGRGKFAWPNLNRTTTNKKPNDQSKFFTDDYEYVELNRLFEDAMKAQTAEAASDVTMTVPEMLETLFQQKSKLESYEQRLLDNLDNMAISTMEQWQDSREHLTKMQIMMKVIELIERDGGFKASSQQQLECFFLYLIRDTENCLESCGNHIDKISSLIVDELAAV